MTGVRITGNDLAGILGDAERALDFEEATKHRPKVKPKPRVTPAQILDFLEVASGNEFDVPPERAIAYFQSKGLLPTWSYADMLGEAHDQAFTVARMVDVDLLSQVRNSLDEALTSGETFNDWKRKLQPMLQKAGWWGKDADGVQLGSAWRLETIFRTNMQTAYAVGQWDEIVEQAEIAPYLMYDAVDDSRTRPEHAAWDRKVLPVTHRWWRTHFPPNGYNCRCSVIQLDAEEVEELGLEVAESAPLDGNYTWTNPKTGQAMQIPNGIDPGFNRNPGRAHLESLGRIIADKIEALPADMRAVAAEAMGPILNREAAKQIAAEAKEAAAQKAAQDVIDNAVETSQPYVAAAIKAVQKTAAGKAMKPTELLDAALEKAAKAEQSAALSNYKQAILAGKEPSAKAKQAFAALSPDDQSKIGMQIANQAAKNEAQAAIDKLAAGEGSLKQKQALKQLQASGEADKLGPVELLGKVDELASEMQAKATATAAVNAYKKNAIAGKIPTPLQKQAFEALPDEQKAKILEEIDKAKAPPPTPDAPQTPATSPINPQSLTQIGPQKGSNPGGLYQDTETGLQWYIKLPGSADKVRNEVLAGKLYQAAGIDVPDLELLSMGGEPAIASRIIDGLTKGRAADLAKAPGSREGFVVDAWLANWDVVGLGYDNLLLRAGKAIRVDTGGALRYRAQGTLKGNAWGDVVDEIDSLRNPGTNSQAASVFGNITQDELLAGARRVLAIDEAQIRDLVRRYGPEDPGTAEALVRTLLARQQDIARRFPEAAQPRSAPQPVDLGARVTEVELKTIKDARLNGYAMPTDKDWIEDQEVLVWHERVKGQADVTRANLKLRGAGIERLEELVRAADGQTVNVLGAINEKIVDTIKGVRKFEGTDGLRAKDIQRAQETLLEWEMVVERIERAVKDGKISQTAADRIRTHYEPWIEALVSVRNGSIGAKNYWSGPKGNFTGESNPDRISTTQSALKFKRKTGPAFTVKEINRGRADDTGMASNAPAVDYYELELPDGTVVRYIADDSEYFALRGRLEIRVNGTDAESATRIFRTLDELGVDGSRATDLDAEELYLTQIAYARVKGWRNVEGKLKTAGTQAQRVEVLKEHLTREIGQDVTTLPGYNPHGQYEAFGHGHRHRYRPDLQGAEWESFRKDYRLHHQITNTSLEDALDQILNAGGKMAPTTDKLRRGIRIGGMSPKADLQTGGASYFFTRIKSVRSARGSQGIVWRSDLMARLDAISYDGDNYGRVTGDHVVNHRNPGVVEWQNAARYGSNETIFKNSLSLFDYLDRIVTKSAKEREAVIKVFKKHGYDQFPDGRSLDEVIK